MLAILIGVPLAIIFVGGVLVAWDNWRNA